MYFISSLILIAVLLQASYITLADRTESSSEREAEILSKILSNTAYNKLVMPPPTNQTGSVKVKLSVYVIKISVDNKKMEYELDMYFRQRWQDSRLKHSDANVKEIMISDASLIWTPDVLIPNSLKSRIAKQLYRDNTNIKINLETGEIYASSRLQTKLDCPMNFRYFPFDEQLCTLEVESYSRSANDLEFSWLDNDAVGINDGIGIVNFRVISFRTTQKTIKLSTGDYSRAILEIGLKRQANYYLVHIYIPSTMLIIVSWLSFWIGVQHLQTRVHIALISLITLALSVAYLNSQLPEVSYTRAIDIWTGVSLTFIFLALIETILVNYLHNNSSLGNSEPETNPQSGEVVYKSVNKPNRQRNPDANFVERIVFNLKQGDTNTIDLLARALFPIVFLLFVIIYICAYVC